MQSKKTKIQKLISKLLECSDTILMTENYENKCLILYIYVCAFQVSLDQIITFDANDRMNPSRMLSRWPLGY